MYLMTPVAMWRPPIWLANCFFWSNSYCVFVCLYKFSEWFNFFRKVYVNSNMRSTRHSSDSMAFKAPVNITRCFSRRSTCHTILGCDELTMWRVDWQPEDDPNDKAVNKRQQQHNNNSKSNFNPVGTVVINRCRLLMHRPIGCQYNASRGRRRAVGRLLRYVIV